jgi:hypothetical protein
MSGFFHQTNPPSMKYRNIQRMRSYQNTLFLSRSRGENFYFINVIDLKQKMALMKSEMWEIGKSFGYFLVNPTWLFFIESKCN